MRRVLRVVGIIVVAGATFVGGVAIGIAVTGKPLDEDAPDGITDAEELRLTDACIASTSAPAPCAGFVADVLDAASASGCGYREAAELVAWILDNRRSTRQERNAASERILDCRPTNVPASPRG